VCWRDGYLQIMDHIYAPKYFYQRIKTFLREYQPTKSSVTIEWNEVAALLKTVVLIGFHPESCRILLESILLDIVPFPLQIPAGNHSDGLWLPLSEGG